RTLATQVDQRLSIIANDRRAMLLSYIGDQEDEIATIAARPELRRLVQLNAATNVSSTELAAAIRPQLTEAAESVTGLSAVWVANLAGDVIASSSPSDVGTSVA